MSFRMPQPGDVFEERYTLEDRLGAGSYAAVYLARQNTVGRSVAIKVLLPLQEQLDGVTLKRFQQEAQLLGELRHPNTLILHDFGWTGEGHPYLVTEHVPGETLKTIIEQGPVPMRRAVKILRQIMGSLQEAHAMGVIHRDIKPANIMLFDRRDTPDVVKVLDFGIAKFVNSVIGEDEGFAQNLTARDRLMGTPRYMAPEQLRKEELSASTDIYALGLVFYEMLAGTPAVEGTTSAVVVAKQLSPDPAVRPGDSKVPAELRAFMARCVAKEPSARFSSMAEALEALESAGLEVSPGPVGLALPELAWDSAAWPDVDVELDGSLREKAPAVEAAAAAPSAEAPAAEAPAAPAAPVSEPPRGDGPQGAGFATGDNRWFGAELNDSVEPKAPRGVPVWAYAAGALAALGGLVALLLIFSQGAGNTASGGEAAGSAPASSAAAPASAAEAAPASAAAAPASAAPLEGAEVLGSAAAPESAAAPASAAAPESAAPPASAVARRAQPRRAPPASAEPPASVPVRRSRFTGF